MFVCSIITHKPLVRFVKSFDWRTTGKLIVWFKNKWFSCYGENLVSRQSRVPNLVNHFLKPYICCLPTFMIVQAFQKKLNDLTNKFPVINSLVNRITLRKRRDTIILGAVVGFCLVFFIWWIFG